MSNHDINLALTFDDVLLLPGFADFTRSEINLDTNLTSKIKLQLPLVSAPMDRVTESRLAIALGKLGGIGIIHRNLTISDQVAEVLKVKKEQLLVGAAIGATLGHGERVKALFKAGVDVIVVDSAHGFSKSVIETTKSIKKSHPKLQVISGNVATFDGAKALIRAGADGLRVGMGPGSICSTRIISGMGVPQITALEETVRAAKPTNTPVIADGGIRYSGDITKALAIGASSVMMGSLFAATDESPGRIITLRRDGKLSKFKEYRGMGSEGAMKTGAKIKSEGEFHNKEYNKTTLIAEGIEGIVPLQGPLREFTELMMGGLRSGMYYVGAKSLPELSKKAKFIKITQASLQESHPHDVFITNGGKNYR